jgi:hypothetical protein
MAKKKWTRERVIEIILQMQKDGDSLNSGSVQKNYQSLYQASIRYFGGWSPALVAAGIDPNTHRKQSPSKMPRVKWTKDKIIAGICQMQEEGSPLNSGSVQKNNHALYQASVSHFGSWSLALEAAGIDPNTHRKAKPKGYWTKERVISEIVRLKGSQEDLSYPSIRKRHKSLAKYAHLIFKGWFKALEASGISSETYLKIKPMGYWTKDKVIETIKGLEKAGQDLNFSETRKKHGSLIFASFKHFGGWDSALDAAGINSSQYRRQKPFRYWTAERVKSEITRLNDIGEDLSYVSIRKKYVSLSHFAEVKFGGWYAALEACNITSDDYRKQKTAGYWTKDRVLHDIRELSKFGEDLSYGAMEEKYTALIKGATKAFGKYEKAVIAAGFDYEKIKKNTILEAALGRAFEIYLEQMLEALEWKVEVQKYFAFGDDACRPDFVDSKTGSWIDAKVDSWSSGVAQTILKYLKYCDNLMIIHLKGKKRNWDTDNVMIMPVSDFYEDLTGCGREDLIRDFEKLKKGIIRPGLQAEIDRFVKREMKKTS